VGVQANVFVLPQEKYVSCVSVLIKQVKQTNIAFVVFVHM